jgi:hypothetical protein
MPVTTQRNVELTLTLDDKSGTTHSFECQIIDLAFSLPGVGEGSTVQTACPDGVVSEPGDPTNGSLTGTAFSDTGTDGITWLLAEAQVDDRTMKYDLTFFPDLGNTKAIHLTGDCKVNSFSFDFSKPGIARTPLDLSIITATMARPTGP